MENVNYEDKNVALINLIRLREKTNSECEEINEKIAKLLENYVSKDLTDDSNFVSLSKELFALHESKCNELTQIDNVISSILEINYSKQENVAVSNFARK